MVVERFDTFLEWLLPSSQHYGALLLFAALASLGLLAGILAGYLIAAFRHGPGEGFYVVAQVIAGSIPDFLKISPRRVLAMARLAIKESIRARVFVVFAVFVVVLLYAQWFLDTDNDHPAKLYLSFVINATAFLMLILAVFISTFSLPNDIKSRTIYTIVTKPVRASEIVIGRILGFVTVGTVLMLAMGVVSYLFVVGGLEHRHELDADAEEVEAAVAKDGFWTGETTSNKRHRHQLTINKDGEAFITEFNKGHRHDVAEQDGRYEFDGPRDQLQARVPRYGTLRFLNRSGGPGEGISVGKEWTYRRYIEGETLAAAVWTFENVRAERFNDELPLELTLSVFRTYKGDIRTPVKGSITLKNPDEGANIRSSVPINFFAREFETDQQFIPRKVQAVRSTGQTVPEADIFDDLCDENGRLEVWIRCEDRSQYFGVSQADCYVLEAERSFAANFFKGFLSIWIQMVLVISFGVAVSTRLNGAISMLAAISYIVIGNMRESIMGVFSQIWQGNDTLMRMFGSVSAEEGMPGGGPIESMIRLLSQKNLTAELDMGWIAEGIIHWLDIFIMGALAAAAHLVPNFAEFNTARYVAQGYDISGSIVATQCVTCLTYVVVMSVIGYFLLKTREIAA